jgi:hypothetical protein
MCRNIRKLRQPARPSNIDSVREKVDGVAYRLYDLSAEEIRVVESGQ